MRIVVVCSTTMCFWLFVFCLQHNHIPPHTFSHSEVYYDCLGWALSLGWFVTHSLYIEAGSQFSPSNSPPNQHPVSSVTLPLPPALFLSLLSSSVSHWGELLMLFEREQNVFKTLSVLFFFSIDTLDKLHFMIWLCWIKFARALLQVSYSPVLTPISLSIREKKRSLGYVNILYNPV